MAKFDTPERAVRCAASVIERAPSLGIQIRAGLRTGQCDLAGEHIRGIAVHIAARVAARAAPGEVLVSNTVKELMVGSEIRFDPRGPTL